MFEIKRHATEFLRYLRNRQFERTENGGILFPRAGIVARGAYFDSVNGAPFQLAGHNLVVNQGLEHFLGVTLTSVSQITTWYLAIFNGAASPAATWTAANFAANATEITTEYDEANRQTWTPDAIDTGDYSVDNDTSPASFTINAALNVEGAALLSSNVKGGTAGILVSATKYAATRVLADGDDYAVRYGIDLNTP
jgi:hypothetical protein